MKIINILTHFAIALLVIPATLNKVHIGLVTILLGMNFVNRGLMNKAVSNKKEYFSFLYSGILIIIVSVIGFII